MSDRLFIPSPCHNFGCVYSEVSGGLSYSQTAKPWYFNEDVKEHHLLKEAYASFYLEVPRPSYKTKSGDTCFVICLASS